MTPDKFEEIKPILLKTFQRAILNAAKKCPKGLQEWLGISSTSGEK